MHRPPDRREVGRIDRVEEMRADATEVRSCRVSQPAKAGRREDRLGAAGVRHARVTLDRPIRDQAIDEARNPASAQEDLVGELMHPEPPSRRLGELEEGVVLGQRQVVLGTQVLVEEA